MQNGGASPEEGGSKFEKTTGQNSPLPQEFYSLSATSDVSLTELFEIIWIGRVKLIISVLVCLFFGIFHYMASPPEYKSTSKLLLEMQDQQSVPGGIRALGQLGGFDIGAGLGRGQGISAELFPEIIESVDFHQQILFQPIYFDKFGKELTLFDYYNEYYQIPLRERVYRGIRNYTIALPITLYNGFRSLLAGSGETNGSDESDVLDQDVLILRSQFRYAMNMMIDNITLETEERIIEIDIKLPDARASAEANVIITNSIRDYVINYRSEKARQNLQFVESLYENAKDLYEVAQITLADFNDRNQGNLTARAEVERDRLDDERSLRFQIYSSISERLEEARVRLQEDTPIFTYFQRPILPSTKERTSLVVIPFSVIVGIFVGFIVIFGTRFYGDFITYMNVLNSKEKGG